MQESRKKQDRRIAKTQASIRSALLELVGEKPLSQITVSELSKRANINRKTFYMYYTNINDIIDKVENDIIEQLLHILEENDYFTSNFDLTTLFYSLNDLISKNLELYRRFVFNNPHNLLLEKIKTVIINSISDNYSKSFNIDPKLFNLSARYVASGVLSMYVDWFTFDTSLTLEEVSKAASELTIHGFQSLLK